MGIDLSPLLWWLIRKANGAIDNKTFKLFEHCHGHSPTLQINNYPGLKWNHI